MIAILMAIAAPSFLGQTKKAQDSVAKQNLSLSWKAALSSATTNSAGQGRYFDAGTLAGSGPNSIQASEPALHVDSSVDDNAAYAAATATDSGPSYIFVSGSTTSSNYSAFVHSDSGTVWCITAPSGGQQVISSECGDTEPPPPTPDGVAVYNTVLPEVTYDSSWGQFFDYDGEWDGSPIISVPSPVIWQSAPTVDIPLDPNAETADPGASEWTTIPYADPSALDGYTWDSDTNSWASDGTTAIRACVTATNTYYLDDILTPGLATRCSLPVTDTTAQPPLPVIAGTLPYIYGNSNADDGYLEGFSGYWFPATPNGNKVGDYGSTYNADLNTDPLWYNPPTGDPLSLSYKWYTAPNTVYGPGAWTLIASKTTLDYGKLSPSGKWLALCVTGTVASHSSTVCSDPERDSFPSIWINDIAKQNTDPAAVNYVVYDTGHSEGDSVQARVGSILDDNPCVGSGSCAESDVMTADPSTGQKYWSNIDSGGLHNDPNGAYPTPTVAIDIDLVNSSNNYADLGYPNVFTTHGLARNSRTFLPQVRFRDGSSWGSWLTCPAAQGQGGETGWYGSCSLGSPVAPDPEVANIEPETGVHLTELTFIFDSPGNWLGARPISVDYSWEIRSRHSSGDAWSGWSSLGSSTDGTYALQAADAPNNYVQIQVTATATNAGGTATAYHLFGRQELCGDPRTFNSCY